MLGSTEATTFDGVQETHVHTSRIDRNILPASNN